MLPPDKNNAFRSRKHPFFSSISYNLLLQNLPSDGRNIQCPGKTSAFCPQKHGFHLPFPAISARTKKGGVSAKALFPSICQAQSPFYRQDACRRQSPNCSVQRRTSASPVRLSRRPSSHFRSGYRCFRRAFTLCAMPLPPDVAKGISLFPFKPWLSIKVLMMRKPRTTRWDNR